MEEEKLKVLKALLGSQSVGAGQSSVHKFWDGQPVPKLDDSVIEENGPIEGERKVEEVRQQPYNLPESFEWVQCDMTESETIEQVYRLLNENYVEDDDNMFRFDYSREFLAWALRPPGYVPDWHLGVRVKASGKIVAFISGIPATIRVYDKTIQTAEINFLCVHKKLRSKRLAPVLIREITRRVNLRGIWQAVYTAGVVLPRPVVRNRYWHRSLNPKKLIAVRFSHLPPNLTMAGAIKLYRVPEATSIVGIRPMREEDTAHVRKLLTEYLDKFHLRVQMNDDEVRHWFLPREGVVTTYVVEQPDRSISDFFSFYTLSSSIIGHDQFKTLKAAYSFYNVAKTVSWKQLISDALSVAKKDGFDVWNALDVMENSEFLKDLKFGIGDGNLHYYLYNWACPQISPEKNGLVLL